MVARHVSASASISTSSWGLTRRPPLQRRAQPRRSGRLREAIARFDPSGGRPPRADLLHRAYGVVRVVEDQTGRLGDAPRATAHRRHAPGRGFQQGQAEALARAVRPGRC